MPHEASPAQGRVRRRAGPPHHAGGDERSDGAAPFAHPALRQTALASPRIRTQANPEARKALLGLEHEHAVSKADFSKPYDAGGASRPLGDAPLLLARIQTGHDRNGQPVVALHPAEGQGVTLSFDSVLLHSVCRLLQAAVKKSDWDMELKLPGTDASEAGERPARTLN